MWVRSQNKEILVEVTHFGLRYDGCEVWDDTREIMLGIFESKKRAIEILNEMQNHIEISEHNKMLLTTPDEQYNYEIYVYGMPIK